MAVAVGAPAADFPQVGNNRTQSELMTEIAEYSGGSSVADQLDRARRALRRAIRIFNSRLWTFNRLDETFDITADLIAPASYQLAADFYRPFRANLLDSNAATRDYMTWIDFGDWKRFRPYQATPTNIPRFYTAANIHESGLVTIDPPPSTALQWPEFNIVYFRRILCPPTDNDKINVPQEVEEAILTRAIYVHMGKTDDRRFARAKELKRDADEAFGAMVTYYEDFAEEQTT